MSSDDRRLALMLRVIAILDMPARWVGKLAAWLIVPMILALVYEVFFRYVLNEATMWAYDITYMLYATMFMLGAAYALQTDSHVRADFLYNMLPLRYQAGIDTFFYILFFFPALVIYTWLTWDFAADSWRELERIPTSPWMPPIYPLKSVMPATGIVLLIQGVSEVLKSLYVLITNERFRSP